MKPAMRKGKLTTWKDDRGFGFITPDRNGKDVFLHISALKGAARRPKLGDRILYEQVIESNGKIRATKASIQGAVPKAPSSRKTQRKNRVSNVAASMVVLAVGVLITIQLTRSRSPSPISSITKPGCDVKGNISYATGNKLYHLPGMKDYDSTVIDPAAGEKWFCTESEALEQGWRKAPR